MKKNGELEYLEFNQAGNASCCNIFLHGYGANARDLSGFHTLKMPVSCRWFFFNGPLSLEKFYTTEARAWFPLKRDYNDHQLRHTEESLFYLNKHCQLLLKFIQSLNTDKIILGGFSQGAIMAIHLALRMNPPPLALVIMSGILFPIDVLNKEKLNFSKQGSYFQCHGNKDPILLHSDAEKVPEFLKSLQWKGKFVSFEGGHEIPHATLLQIQEFISHKLS